MRFYLGEASWWSFTEPEQAILRRVSRVFARELREAGFLPKESENKEPQNA
jgi:RPA family protein